MKHLKINKIRRKGLVFCFVAIILLLITFGITTFAATKEYYLGDTNLDNEITLSDELLIKRHIYSMKYENKSNWKLTGDALVNADINEDGVVDISDILYIKRYMASKKDSKVDNKHKEWGKLCKKKSKNINENKSYTLVVNPGEKEYKQEPNSTVTVTAPEVNYTVSFETNGGNSIGSKLSKREFLNWTLKGAGKIENNKLATTKYTFGTSDATLTANYNSVGNEIILPNSEKEGAAVEGWYDTEDLKNKIGNVGDSFSPTGDITLYAKWIDEKIEPTGISINKNNVTIDISENKIEELSAQITPANSNYNNELTWKSSNSNVATVSDKGIVTGVSNGQATISVESKNGYKAECNVTVETSPTGIKLNVTNKTLDLSGEKTFTLEPIIEPSTANVNKKIMVKNSNDSAINISENGVVTGISNGLAVITLQTENGKIATCNVTVQTSPTNLTVDKEEVNIDLSESTTKNIVATIEPSSSNVYTKISWNTSNPKVATVSDDGIITGISNGEATITAKTGNGKIATCKVIVQTSPTAVVLDKTSIEINSEISTYQKLIATINPETSNVYTKLSWTSNNPDIAMVSDDGTVTGKATGATQVKVETQNGKYAICDVTVKIKKEEQEDTNISLNKNTLDIDLSDKISEKLIATTNSSGKLTWESSKNDVATVSDDGTVTGLKNGETIITVKTSDNKTASCKVTVYTTPKSVTLDKTSITLDENNSTTKLIATINPETSNVYNLLSWKSNNSNIATVSDDGTVTGKATGTTQIRVETQNGKYALCDVDVNLKKDTTITLNKDNLVIDLSISKTEKLVATTNSQKSLIWNSSNIDVATVSDDGTITGLKNGTTTITATTYDGVKASCDVTVQTSVSEITLNALSQTLDLSGTKTFQIIPTIIPSTANVNTTLYIKSNNTNIATVSEQGIVTGVSNGKTEIIVYNGSGKTASLNVTVQTSPTGIYFSENKDDSSKYLTVGKGSNLVVNAKLEPSTANVNTDIKYSIYSGNNKVASINSSTGEVTGGQAGVVTIRAQASNGQTADINLNVKIGNEVFDTEKTIKLKANTSDSLIYSKAVDLSANTTIGSKSHLQNFAVASSGDIYYTSYPGTSDSTGKHHISIGRPSETPYKCMTLNYFGHGSAFDLENGSGGGKVWIDSVTAGLNDSNNYDGNYAFSRIQWANQSEYYFAAGSVKVTNSAGKELNTYNNPDGENFVVSDTSGITKSLRTAVDETNRLILIRNGREYLVYDLDEALNLPDKKYQVSSSTKEHNSCTIEFWAKNINDLTPLTKFKIKSAQEESDILYWAWQGMDIDGDNIYIAEGDYTSRVSPIVHNGKAFVTVFDYMYDKNGNKTSKPKIEVVAVNEEWTNSKKLLAQMGDDGSGGYGLAQIEGIRVTTQGGKKEMYLGFDSNFKSTGKRSANILKYTY